LHYFPCTLTSSYQGVGMVRCIVVFECDLAFVEGLRKCHSTTVQPMRGERNATPGYMLAPEM